MADRGAAPVGRVHAGARTLPRPEAAATAVAAWIVPGADAGTAGYRPRLGGGGSAGRGTDLRAAPQHQRIRSLECVALLPPCGGPARRRGRGGGQCPRARPDRLHPSRQRSAASTQLRGARRGITGAWGADCGFRGDAADAADRGDAAGQRGGGRERRGARQHSVLPARHYRDRAVQPGQRAAGLLVDGLVLRPGVRFPGRPPRAD